MSMPPRAVWVIVFWGLTLFGAQSGAAQSTPQAPEQAAPVRQDPELKLRPAPEKDKTPEGRIRLDVVVTDGSGNPVAGIDAKDFELLDEKQTQKIISFRAVDGKQGEAASRVAVFLVLDTVNSGLQDVSFMRQGVEKFLRQNGGHLTQPVTVMLLTEAGFQLVGKTSLDGSALADAVHETGSSVHAIHSSAGIDASIERFQLSAKALMGAAAQQASVPGRKMVIWAGPAWPILRQPEQNYNARSHELNFEAIATVTNQLRDARMLVCSAGGGQRFFVEDLLKPVKTPTDADSAHLALQVIAVNSGGRTIKAGNRTALADELNHCMQEIGPYYTLTFDPSDAKRPYQYHALKVIVHKSGLTANTSAGYYAEP